MTARVRFCGALNGQVALRPGETPDQALDRAEATLQRVLDLYAKRLDTIVGLEPDDTPEAV